MSTGGLPVTLPGDGGLLGFVSSQVVGESLVEAIEVVVRESLRELAHRVEPLLLERVDWLLGVVRLPVY